MPTNDHRAELMSKGDDPLEPLRSELLARWDATLPRQPELGEQLIRRYSEPHRHYHTTEHLIHVLNMVDRTTPGFAPSTGLVSGLEDSARST